MLARKVTERDMTKTRIAVAGAITEAIVNSAKTGALVETASLNLTSRI